MRDDSSPETDAPARADSPRRTLVIWHGYLLGATGSNIYTHHLVDSWVRAGHDVVLACQEADPSRHPSIQEAVWLEGGSGGEPVGVRERRVVRERAEGEGRCTMVVPDLGGVLPVYVLDRYEGFEVVRVPGLDPARLEAYLAAHASAMRWVVGGEFGSVDGVLVNHASPLPQALAPVLAEAGVPFAVKVHGSELEYALAEDESLVAPAAAALAQARSVLVGSTHIERRTRELLGDAAVDGRVAIVPPGVDLERFRPVDQADSARREEHAQLVDELRERGSSDPGGRDRTQREQVEQLVAHVGGDDEAAGRLVPALRELHGSYEERNVEQPAAERVEAIDPTRARMLVYVGKLIPQKGVHLLLATLPDLLEQHPDVHVVIAGFGPLREGLEAMLTAMVRRDGAALDALADQMGELSGEGGSGLPHLRAFLDSRREAGTLGKWLERAARSRVDEHVTWLGLVDHAVLAHLWPLAESSVVPSVMAEAFGMVAAEAAACGCVPVLGNHSGLADAAAVIEQDGVEPIRFDALDVDHAIDDLTNVLLARLALGPVGRSRQGATARRNVAAAWGWDELAEQVAALMAGS